MWRGLTISFSKYISPLPKQASDSLRASSNRGMSCSGSYTRRIPRPPPPAEALMSTGYPMESARALACSAVSTAPSEPGTTGTPALCISFRAAALLPMARITSPEGPMKVMPAASQASAKSAFSLRKP